MLELFYTRESDYTFERERESQRYSLFFYYYVRQVIVEEKNNIKFDIPSHISCLFRK